VIRSGFLADWLGFVMLRRDLRIDGESPPRARAKRPRTGTTPALRLECAIALPTTGALGYWKLIVRLQGSVPRLRCYPDRSLACFMRPRRGEVPQEGAIRSKRTTTVNPYLTPAFF